MMNNNVCPVCEVGELRLSTFTATIANRGGQLAVPGMEAWLCVECGERSMEAHQIKANNVTVANARKAFADRERTAAGLLTGAEILRIREVLGLTQAEASRSLAAE